MCYWIAAVITVAVVRTLGGVQTQLTKVLLQKEEINTIPVRSINETVHAEVGLTLWQVIELVWYDSYRWETVENIYVVATHRLYSDSPTDVDQTHALAVRAILWLRLRPVDHRLTADWDFL